jgi:hypothetical protein
LRPVLAVVETPLPTEANSDTVTVRSEPSTNNKVHAEETIDNLSPFQKWAIQQIRESKCDGITFSVRFQSLKKRCELLDGVKDHHKQLLAEIHFQVRTCFE